MPCENRTRKELLAEIEHLRYCLKAAQATRGERASSHIADIGGYNPTAESQTPVKSPLKTYGPEMATLMDVVPAAVFIAHDVECRTMSGSRFTQELLGLPPTANVSRSAPASERPATFKAMHEGREIPADQLPVQIAARGREVRDYELDIVFPDKPTRTIFGNAAPLWDPVGRPAGAIGAFIDITDRKLGEEALRRSEQLYRAIGESIDYGVWVCDRDGRNMYASASFLRLVGITQEQCSNFGWADALHPDDRERTVSAWKECVRTQGTWDIEHRFRGVDGQWHPILARGVPVRDDRGELTCWAGINLDISGLKQAQEAVRSNEVRLLLALDAAHLAMWDWDIATGTIIWNSEHFRMLGYEPDSFAPTYRHWSDRVHPDDLQATEARIRRAIDEGGDYRAEFRVLLPDGTVRNLEALGRVGHNSAGVAERLYGAMSDITGQKLVLDELQQAKKLLEQRVAERTAELSRVNDRLRQEMVEHHRSAEAKSRLEAQLRHSQKVEAIGRLAGGIAHDFNNLMAIILGYGELLLGEYSPTDPLRRYAEQILAAGQRSATLTRQLLAFGRKQALQLEVLDLNTLLRDCKELLGRLIGDDVELEVRLAADPGRVVADPGQLRQVVTNLALNARDAMASGGRLTMATTDVEIDAALSLGQDCVAPGRYVVLAVTDTGCGLDKASMDHLFEPFYTTKPKGKGTGLGLATAYGIVKQSRGYIGASSAPGKGTTFSIYLPWTDAALAVKTTEDAGGETPRGSGERILLVEDEASLRELCEALLTHLGYRVSVAASGREAVALVREQELAPDLVVTDVVMPGMSGPEAADQIRRIRPEQPVLYMSGYTDDAIAHHGVLDPGVHFIPKPFTERALAMKIREALQQDAAALRPPNRRVLMIDDDDQFRELVGHYCLKRGHVFTGADSAAAALEALAAQPCDVLLIDLNIPGTSGERILREIRAAGYTAPAIVLSGDLSSADMDALLPLGAVRALQKSSDSEPLLQAIAAVGTPHAPSADRSGAA